MNISSSRSVECAFCNFVNATVVDFQDPMRDLLAILLSPLLLVLPASVHCLSNVLVVVCRLSY